MILRQLKELSIKKKQLEEDIKAQRRRDALDSLERENLSADELTYTVEDDGGDGVTERALFDKTNLIANMDIVKRTKNHAKPVKTTHLTPRGLQKENI